jgi:hypothetical protein
VLRCVLSQTEEVGTRTGLKISVGDYARSLIDNRQRGASGNVTRKAAPIVAGSSEILPL